MCEVGIEAWPWLKCMTIIVNVTIRVEGKHLSKHKLIYSTPTITPSLPDEKLSLIPHPLTTMFARSAARSLSIFRDENYTLSLGNQLLMKDINNKYCQKRNRKLKVFCKDNYKCFCGNDLSG